MEFLTSGFNVLLIIAGFGLLIFIHELGHFVAAKWAGIRTEAFAVGMGPVALAWRKGIGVRFGSTAGAYEKRVRKFLESNPHHLSSVGKDAPPAADVPQAEMYRIGDQLGLGETEYSLRWLPLGGFVKMLGQEDANPNYVSNDPRSYTRCSVGKRMIVVSAGVVMNIILAMVLFVIAFLAGVKFEAPVVGDVSPRMPAGTTAALNAAEAGVTSIGLQSGDIVTHINGEPARTFADLQIASAMSKPGDNVRLIVHRDGTPQPLQFALSPQRDAVSGLLGIGIYPGASPTLLNKDDDDLVQRLLQRSGLAEAGVKLGMTITSVNGQSIMTYGQLTAAADHSNGEPLHTIWVDQREANAAPINAVLKTHADYAIFRQHETDGDVGLIGLSPLPRVIDVLSDSPNAGVLKAGDVFVMINSVDFPRRSQLLQQLQANKSRTIPAIVWRDDREHPIDLAVNRDGQMMVEIGYADDLLLTAQPILTHSRYRDDDSTKTEDVATPIQSAEFFTTGGTRVLQVNDEAVSTWAELRQALKQATHERAANREAATVRLVVAHPTSAHEQHNVEIAMTAADVKQLHELGWSIEIPSIIFEPIQVTLSADGSPLKAIQMGFAETKKLVLMTYLTIDRLIRGSVGVEQLRGPVGIIHIGSKVADRGFMYIIFFLGMISVNLAVINFLPMPIVDGGLFLFLIYEKFKGRPPSMAFQNAATIAGLCLIGTLFLITFYNDVLRLLN